MHRFFCLALVLWSATVGATNADRMWTYDIVDRYPHNVSHFTQGLLMHEGHLIESTGGYGESALYKKVLETGEIIHQQRLPAHYFGEGITVHGDRIWQLTWRERALLIYDMDLQPLTSLILRTEGWGLTGDGERIWMTDGSATLYELDPHDGQIRSRITVKDGTRSIAQLNELEYIDGLIFANVWQRDEIVIFDPDTGEVKGWLALGELGREVDTMTRRSRRDDVLNGIAWDAKRRLLLVTGKRWPLLFALRVMPPDHSPVTVHE